MCKYFIFIKNSHLDNVHVILFESDTWGHSFVEGNGFWVMGLRPHSYMTGELMTRDQHEKADSERHAA